MTTIAVFNQKGGVGKSMLTVHLAVAAGLTGRKVLILDLDPQGSSAAWHAARGEGTEPPVLAVGNASLDRSIANAKALDFNFILIDSPPSVSPTTAKIISAADLVIIPIRPVTFDVAALPATVKLVGSKPYVFVLSDCPQRAPETEETRQALLAFGKPILGPINNWRSMWRALVTGQAIIESAPESKAAEEMKAVCADILKEITNG